jgi:hypothetical protein
MFNNKKLTNSFFGHKYIRRYAWPAWGSQSIVAYILIHDKLRDGEDDTTINTGAYLWLDRFLLMRNVKLRSAVDKKQTKRAENKLHS